LSLAFLLQALWTDLAEHSVLVAPGSMFSGRTFPPSVPTDEFTEDFSAESWQQAVNEEEGDGFFRIAFSTASKDDMKKATAIIGQRVAKFFKE
jgi:aromatic amino acid aminotransferase I